MRSPRSIHTLKIRWMVGNVERYLTGWWRSRRHRGKPACCDREKSLAKSTMTGSSVSSSSSCRVWINIKTETFWNCSPSFLLNLCSPYLSISYHRVISNRRAYSTMQIQCLTSSALAVHWEWTNSALILDIGWHRTLHCSPSTFIEQNGQTLDFSMVVSRHPGHMTRAIHWIIVSRSL